MKTRLNEQMSEYKAIETYSHVTLDDVLNKVTQEVGELIEASEEWNHEEMYKEAWDVIINILSVCEELWMDIYNIDSPDNEANSTKLAILLWKWNSKIQAYRGRYSREDITFYDVQEITSDLVKTVLNYTDPSMDLGQIIKRNTNKFDSRKDLYKPQIDLWDYIESFEGFPKPWISFKDIWPILKSKEALDFAVKEMAMKCTDSDVIGWLDARGFIFWSLVAKELGKPFVMLRKKWKLPGKTKWVSYWLEYWKDNLEIQEWSIEKGQKVSLVDDLLATGWTIKAAIDLVESLGWVINNLSFVISLDENELASLESRKKLYWYKIDTLVSYS